MDAARIVDRDIYVLLAYGLQHLKMYKIVNRVNALIDAFGTRILTSVLGHGFDIICGNVQANVSIKDVKGIVYFTVMRCQNDSAFDTFAARFFDELPEFPRDILESMTHEVEYKLAIAALNSKHGSTAANFLAERAESRRGTENAVPMEYSAWIHPSRVLCVGELAGDMSMDSIVSISGVLDDFDVEERADPDFIRTFFDRFPSVPFSSYLVCLLVDRSTVSVENVLEFVGDLIFFVRGLDVVESMKLTRTDVMFVFDLISAAGRGELISTRVFLEEWKYPEVQYHFLRRIAESTRHEFDFGICWGSRDFVERVVGFPNKSQTIRLFVRYASMYPDLSLLSLSHLGGRLRDPALNVFLACLTDKFFAVGSKSRVLRSLWASNPEMMRSICERYSIHRDYAAIIAVTPHEYYAELWKGDDIMFITDIALFGAWSGVMQFREFMQGRESQIPGIAVRIVMHMDDGFGVSDTSLNEFFEYTWQIFGKLSVDARRMVSVAYKGVKSYRPNLMALDFNVTENSPSVEMKFQAASQFERYMYLEIGPEKMHDIIQELRASNHELFDYMCAVLVKEFKHMDIHNEAEKGLVFRLVIDMLRSKTFDESWRNVIFGDVLADIPSFGDFIEMLMEYVDMFPYFASLLLQNEKFPVAFPDLYKRLEMLLVSMGKYCDDKYDEITIHAHVTSVAKYETPTSRLGKLMTTAMDTEAQAIATISKNTKYYDWLADRLIRNIIRDPQSLRSTVRIVRNGSANFRRVFIIRCVFDVFSIVQSEQVFDTTGGRRLYLLGRIVGQLTVGVNSPMLLRYLQIKKLLENALTTGKLCSVIPFVCAILRSSSPLFRPPNSWTTGILSMLASIFVIPTLKYSIVLQIENVFGFFGLQVDDMRLERYTPRQRISSTNDFVEQPFNLSLFLCGEEIRQLIEFDENLYFRILFHHVDIEPLTGKVVMIWKLFALVKKYATELSRKIVAMAECTMPRNKELVNQFAQQTAAAMVSHPVFFDYTAVMMYISTHDFAAKNRAFIQQFLASVTTFHAVSKMCDFVEGVGPMNSALSNQWALLRTSPVTRARRLRAIEPDPHTRSWIASMYTLCKREDVRGFRAINDLPDCSQVYAALREWPGFSGDQKAIFQAFVGGFERGDFLLWHQLLATVMDRTFRGHANDELRAFVLEIIWGRCLSPLMIMKLISLDLASATQIDTIFYDILNDQVVSEESLAAICTFMTCFVVEQQLFNAGSFVKTLSVISFANVPGTTSFLKLYEEEKYVNKQVQIEHPFNPEQDIPQKSEFLSRFKQFKNAIRQRNETQLTSILRTIVRSQRDFFVAVFIREDFKDIENMLKCMKKVDDNMTNIISAILRVVICCNSSPLFDLWKFYLILRSLCKYCDCVPLLHQVRPLKCPGFAMPWILLVTAPRFIISCIHDIQGWAGYALLFCDFAATIGYIGDTFEPLVFQKYYRSFLRCLLVMSHDFPDFVAAVASNTLSVLPLKFIQVRNIILSVAPTDIIDSSSPTPITRIDQIPDVHQPRFEPFPLVLPNDVERKLTKVVSSSSDIDNNTVDFFIGLAPIHLSALASRAFTLTIAEPKRTEFKTLPVCVLFNAVVSQALSDTSWLYIETFIDQLRYQCRDTHFFSRLLIDMFLRDHVTRDGHLVSEGITTLLVKRASLPPPHPWGLRVVLIELMTNRDCRFWELPFVTENEHALLFLKSLYAVFLE